MTSPAVPNLFVIGAPKCGTTSLFHWLAEHPDICGASVKETYYLLDPDYPMGRDGYDSYHRSGLEGYSAYFRDCRGEPYRLEATPDYLYQQTALDVISRMESPQVLVVLRKPSERVYSLYQFARNNAGTLDLDISFSEFVDVARNGGELLANKPILRMAVSQSEYVDYLERWVAAVGREAMHVILFEELALEPLRCMQRLARQLGVDPAYYDDFDFVVHNRTGTVKSKALHRLRRRAHTFISRHFARFIPDRVKHTVHSFYEFVNQRPEKVVRTADEQRVIEELDAYFAPFNRRLEELTGLDLSAWDGSH